MNEPWLPSEHGTEKGGLQRRVARGLTWTLIDTWGAQLLGLLIFVILARILTPVDFGLVALAAVFVSFAQLFVDQGLGDAIIQKRAVTRRQLDTAFWVAFATGLILTALGIVLAGPIARLLNEPALEPILMVLSLVFTLSSFNSIQMALMRREMDFKRLAVRKLAAVAAGGVVGVALAVGNYGAWALVGQQLTTAAVSVLMLWTISPWRPSFNASRTDFRDLAGFGFHVVASDILSFLSRNVDRLLIGAYLGPAALGFYAVGHRVLETTQQMLINFARKLAFPIFARLQGNEERLRRAYDRVTRAISVIIIPGYIGLALVAQEAVVVLFGQRWAESGPVAAVMFLIGPVLTLQLFSGALLNAVGHPEVTFRMRLVNTIVNVVGFFIAVFFFKDIVAVAAAYVVRGYLLAPLIAWWLRDYVGIPMLDNIRQVRSALISTAVMAVAVLAVKLPLVGHVHNVVLLFLEVTVGMVVFFVTLYFVERPLLHEVTVFGLQVVPGGGKVARRYNLHPDEAVGTRAGKPTKDADEGVETAADPVVAAMRTGDGAFEDV